MELFRHRPLCLICTFALFGAFAGCFLPRYTLGILLAAFSAVTLLVGLLRDARQRKPFTAWLLILSSAAVCLGFGASARYYQGTVVRCERFSTDDVCIAEGVIIRRAWNAAHGAGFIVSVKQCNGEPIHADMLLECLYPSDLQPGFSVRITTTAEPLSEDSAGFAQRNYYLSHGVVLRLTSSSSSDVTILSEEAGSLRVDIERLNHRLAYRLLYAAGDDAGGLLSALLLGRRDLLAESTMRDFRRMGISHLLALSGMHLSVLCSMLTQLLRRTTLPKRGRILLQMTLLFGYVLLAGCPRSLTRAALMLALTLAAEFFAGEPDARTALFSAVALICLADPAAILDVSLWMSALATLGILLVGEIRLRSRKPLRRYFIQSILVTLAANLMTLPCIWLINGEFALLSLPANLLFAPIMSLLLLCAPVILLLGDFGGFLFAPLLWVARTVLRLCAWFAHLPGITVSMQHDFLPWTLLIFCVTLALLLILPLRRKWSILLPVIALVITCTAGIILHHMQQPTDAFYLQSGKNEGILLCDTGKALFCEIGDGSLKLLRSGAAKARQTCCTEIDTLMLTHYHRKIVNSVTRLSHNIIIRQILLPIPTTNSEYLIFLDLMQLAEEEKCTIALYADGDVLTFGSYSLCAYTRTRIKRSTQPLILLGITCGEEHLTYIGASVEESTLAEQSAAMGARSSIIMLGAHGPVRHAAFSVGTSTALRHLAVANENLLTMLDWSDAGMADALLRCRITTGEVRLLP